MREKRKIVDTTLRDGEQQAGIALRPEEKLEIALLLDAIGVHEIEAGIPSLGAGEISYLKAVMKRKNKHKFLFGLELIQRILNMLLVVAPILFILERLYLIYRFIPS